MLFAEDYEGVSLEVNGDVAVLLNGEQAIAVRKTLNELVPALEGCENEE